MIERLIFTALQNGITELTENPTRLEQIFQEYHRLSATETAAIRKVYEASPPSIIHGYAREDAKFPLFAIVLNTETETTKFLGDHGGYVDAALADDMYETLGAAEDLEDREKLATMFAHTYNILIYTKHPDVTIYYYALAKYFLFRAREYFKTKGLYDLVLAGGDIGPDGRYIPAYLFVRRLTFSCAAELAAIGAKPADLFTSMEGMFVPDLSSVTTQTKANVTPYITSE
jgi:hypothetical protein